ncbi:hypothetical protein LCGC14_2817100 [marine sediment metagenome]|uniref:Uncharacterized protein n=1 Tax=marine sediment metagenome TaxID=412755 RepID=A0A0F8YI44_9ZZZZ
MDIEFGITNGKGRRITTGLIEDPKTLESVRFNIAKEKAAREEGKPKERTNVLTGTKFEAVGKVLDVGTAALGQPLKTARAVVDPRITVQQSVEQFWQQSSPKIILDLGLTGLTIGGVGLTLKAFTTGGKFATKAISPEKAFVGRVQARLAAEGAGRTATAGAITGFPAFGVTEKIAVPLAVKMAALKQLTASQIVKRGIGLAWKFKGRTLGIVGGVTGAQMLWTWFAVDNVMTGASIYSRDTANAVRFGALSRGEAIAGLDEAQQRVNQAKRFAQIQSLNPLVALFSRNIRNGISQVQAQIELQYRLLGVRR